MSGASCVTQPARCATYVVDARARSSGFYHDYQKAAADSEHQVPEKQLEVERCFVGGGGGAAGGI
jgi:hypothetical protein